MSVSRRTVLMGATALGATGAAAWGFSQTVSDLVDGFIGEAKAKGIVGRSLPPEYTVDPATGRAVPNPDQRVAYSMCLGCTTVCGIRVRVDKRSGAILRVTGNPYSPLSTNPHLPYATPIADALTNLSRFEERGLAGRSTACGRGNAAIAKQDAPERVLKPLKRVGKRGGGNGRRFPGTSFWRKS